jgi:diguanylate cyclase (GGDEF)-like protein/PAS domain S-box-containing protein
MHQLANYRTAFKKMLWILLLLACVQIFTWFMPAVQIAKGLAGYAPLHTILETFAIVISMMVFAIGWGVYKEARSYSSIWLSSIFFGVGILDILHTLSFPSMPDFFTPSDPEKAIYFWLVARLLSGFGLLALTWVSLQKLIVNRHRWMVMSVVLIFTLVSSVIGFKYLQLLPHTFVTGYGLTSFKLNVEFFIIALNITAAIRFLMEIKVQQTYDAAGLFGAAILMALSEVYFTLYSDVTDIFNLLGHVYKVIAYGFIYKSIFLISIREPYRQLNDSKNILQTVIDNLPLRVFWKDRELRYLGCNTIFSKDAGKESPRDIIGKFDTQLAWRDQASLYQEDDKSVINSNSSKLNFEEPQTTPDGKRIWLRTSKVPLVDVDRRTIGVLGIYEDISDRKELEEKYYMAFSAIEHSKIAHFWVNSEGCVTYANEYACKSLGYFRDELIGMSIWDFDPDFKQTDQSQFWTDVKREGVFNLESRHKTKGGKIFPVEITANYISSGNEEQVFCAVQDITKRKQAEESIWQHANLDTLTGLPNRRMFKDRLEQEIKKANRTLLPLALLFLDLDNFKEVNDVMGHAKGDMLLKQAANRIATCVRGSDTVARFGGDEFTILLSEVHDTASIDRVIQNILKTVSVPFALDGQEAYVTASIGVTCYPSDGVDIDELLKNADQAMYAAKDNGRNRFCYYSPSMQATAQSRMKLTNDLRSALSENQFWVAYQPIIELKSGKIIKAEALIRWQHPKHGLVDPAQFISIAEHTGLINEIGEFVFVTAAKAVKGWQDAFDPDFQISVNVSPVQFNGKSNKLKSWGHQLKALGLKGRSIVVEITESLLLEASTSILDKLLEFRDAGIQVALDDFGTGYSALSYLKKFDIDYIKIDQSFVRNLPDSSEDLALCEAIIVMAHRLGLKVIAEGVETVEQRQLLTNMDCDYAQGYLISKPVPITEFEKLLTKIYTKNVKGVHKDIV